MRIETDLDGAVVAAIERHYNHAREKHPYFCDMVTRDLWAVKDIQDHIKIIRQYIEQDIARHEVEAMSLLICETREFEEAMTLKDTAAAVEELYDVIAVCLRIIDVLEGRQALGMPKEGGAR